MLELRLCNQYLHLHSTLFKLLLCQNIADQHKFHYLHSTLFKLLRCIEIHKLIRFVIYILLYLNYYLE